MEAELCCCLNALVFCSLWDDELSLINWRCITKWSWLLWDQSRLFRHLCCCCCDSKCLSCYDIHRHKPEFFNALKQNRGKTIMFGSLGGLISDAQILALTPGGLKYSFPYNCRTASSQIFKINYGLDLNGY